MIKFEAKRMAMPFSFDLENGKTIELEYLEQTTKQTKKAFEDNDATDYSIVKTLLEENLKGKKEDKKAFIEALENNGNIFRFKAQLDVELGKLNSEA